MPAKYEVDYKRFQDIEDPEPPKPEEIDYLEPDEAVNKAYETEMVKDRPVDKLREMKIKLAMDAYERRRPKDKIMHHYVVKDAGDVDAIGEYYATGDERNSCPIYMNANGITLTREKQPASKDTDEEQYGWILGSIEERRPLYGVMSDDLSVPTLGWQGFTAPEPVPTVRYYSHASAARLFKDKGNAAVQAKELVEAEGWYTKALATKMDPNEFPEPMAMIYSNRAQVRLTLLKYSEAADDADLALRFLRMVPDSDAPTIALKQKTYVRRARALAAMTLFSEAETVMAEAHNQFPDSDDINTTWKEMKVAKTSDGPMAPLLRFVSQSVSSMKMMTTNSSVLGDALFPPELQSVLLKLEYVFSKADGEALADLQTLLRANGGLRSLLQTVKMQWKCNLEGKSVDMYKLDSLCTVLSIIALACDGAPESIKLAASEAPALFSALGGCNRKVSAEFTSSLLGLVSQVWSTCKSAASDALQSNTAGVELASATLAKLILNETLDGSSSLDAPVVGKADKDKAFDLLSGLSSAGGRLEKRSDRGAVPMVASFDGTGFLTAEGAQYRKLGALLLEKATKDASLLSATDVRNLLIGVQLLIMCGTKPQASLVGGVNLGAWAGTERKVDLEAWLKAEDGQNAKLMLGAVAAALEYRLLRSHELGKGEYEDAFAAGYGWTVCIPLLEAPADFAVPAMTCMGAMPSMPSGASAMLLGSLLKTPAQVKKGLAESPSFRSCAAKILSKCTGTECPSDILKEETIAVLVKLIMGVSLDGKSSLEALHDMLYTFYQISQSMQYCPKNAVDAAQKCMYTNDSFMTMLVTISKAPVEEAPNFYAKGILGTLRLNRQCDKVVQAILSRAEAGVGSDDILKAD